MHAARLDPRNVLVDGNAAMRAPFPGPSDGATRDSGRHALEAELSGSRNVEKMTPDTPALRASGKLGACPRPRIATLRTRQTKPGADAQSFARST